MIIGNPYNFAIESEIVKAYSHPGFLGLGYFIVHVKNQTYGIRDDEATLLAGALGSMQEHLEWRGKHIAEFAGRLDSVLLSNLIYGSIYRDAEEVGWPYPLPQDEIEKTVIKNNLLEKCFDQAFDDGSYLSIIDNEESTRVLAFRSTSEYDVCDVSEAIIASDEFYSILESWTGSILRQWKSMKKES